LKFELGWKEVLIKEKYYLLAAQIALFDGNNEI